MKNIQVIDGAENCTYDIYSVTDQQFALIFPSGEDIAFIEVVYARESEYLLNKTFSEIWNQRIQKTSVIGIHGTLFYGLQSKAEYYPTRVDEEAVNPDGSAFRNQLA